MDGGRGLSLTLLVLVRYNCVSFEKIMDFTKTLVNWIGGGGCAKLSNGV